VEVYHEEGKAEGLDQYQIRSFSAIQRHVALVAVVYSLLRAAQHDPVLRERLQQQLKVKLVKVAQLSGVELHKLKRYGAWLCLSALV